MLQIDFLISNAIHAILMPKVTMLLGYRRAEVGIRLGCSTKKNSALFYKLQKYPKTK